MSRRTKQCGSLPRPDGKARRLFQLMHQRQLATHNGTMVRCTGKATGCPTSSSRLSTTR
jgi:hypothetical protein